MNTRLWIPASFTLALFACDPASDRADERATAAAVEEEAPASPRLEAPAKERHVAAVHFEAKRDAVMPNARAGFEQVVELINKHYVDGPLSEDALWTGAIEGVMGRLHQLEGHPINALLSPDELSELEIGTKGQIVGVGVMIEFVANVLVIRDVIPGAPAATAGLQAGDRILGVDGVRLKDNDMHAIVGKIRGEAGTTVELFVQRDTEEWTVEITRGAVHVASVEGRLLEGGVGYLRINAFTEKTADEVAATLETLTGEGMKALVLDLRTCPGGLLDASVAVADALLPAGARVVTVRGRDGAETQYDTKGDGRWQQLPLAVLVGPKTASGAEILAAALAHHDRGPLIGEPPLGKRTVEGIHELGDRWAIKLTGSRFVTPGEVEGAGLRPDITIPTAPDQKMAPLRDLNVDADPPLRAAVDLLEAKAG
ncbi:MAG: S41 family peptidase [Myxococcales bacterium]|nr:S41 family peptidase [Myxococcales bacterium]